MPKAARIILLIYFGALLSLQVNHVYAQQATVIEITTELRMTLYLEKVSGDGQFGCVNSQLAEPLVVKVTYPDGTIFDQPTDIEFAVTQAPLDASGYSFSNMEIVTLTTVTTENGYALVNFILGDNGGEYVITATPLAEEIIVRDSGPVARQTNTISFTCNSIESLWHGILTPVDNFTGRSLTRCGIGEVINLSVSIDSGCQVNGFDTVTSGNRPAPFGNGTFDWPIPWQYSIGGMVWRTFTTATCNVDAVQDNGEAIIQKAGAGPFSRIASDPTSTY